MKQKPKVIRDDLCKDPLVKFFLCFAALVGLGAAMVAAFYLIIGLGTVGCAVWNGRSVPYCWNTHSWDIRVDNGQ